MKTKQLLSAIISFCFIISISPSTKAQIFISEAVDGVYLLGPQSVSPYWEELSTEYISEIGAFRNELQGLQATEENVIATLQANEKLKRRERQQLVAAEQRLELLNIELQAIDTLQNQWYKQLVQTESIRQLFDWINDGHCAELTTTDGIYYSDEIVVSQLSGTDQTSFEEWFAVDYQASGTEWVKKKADRNCLSDDPNDCLVWCLVEKKQGIVFTDFQGFERRADTCPENFTFHSELNHCIRQRTLDEIADDSEAFVIRERSSQQEIQVLSWNAFDCQ